MYHLSLFTIFKSLIRPLLDCGNIIYDQAYNAVFYHKLEFLQYNAALAITGAIRGTSREKKLRIIRLGIFPVKTLKFVVLINFSRATLQITFSMTSPKNRVWTPNLDLRKNGTPKNGLIRKTGPTGLKLLVKTLPFGSSHMKDNAEVIHFNIKSRDV